MISASIYNGIYGTNTSNVPLISEWENSGYPEYITYIYESGGWRDEKDVIYKSWEIGVYNATQEEKYYIISLFPNTCVINFKECSLNYSARIKIMNDIIALNDNHIKSVKLVKNNEQIYVLVDKGYVNKYSELLTGQYSKFINITDESGITIEQKSNFYYQFIFIVIIFIFMITSIIISYRKRLLNKR
jgi:uncharacterized cysteine cluster protein YcgN (CxxCxxCC family)